MRGMDWVEMGRSQGSGRTQLITHLGCRALLLDSTCCIECNVSEVK